MVAVVQATPESHATGGVAVTLVAEVEPGQSVVHEIASVDRADRITPATLGLSIAKGKAVLAAIQAQLVVDQVTLSEYTN